MPRSKLSKKPSRSPQKTPPSLAKQCKKSLKRHLPEWCVEDIETTLEESLLEEAQAVQASAIQARGRIIEMEYKDQSAFAFPVAVPNKHQHIDGARFQDYDEDTRTVTIRVDHSTHPSFWLELDFRLPDLERWLGSQIDCE